MGGISITSTETKMKRQFVHRAHEPQAMGFIGYPTSKVVNYLKEFHPGEQWTPDKVDSLAYWYAEAIKNEGFDPFEGSRSSQFLGLINFLKKETALTQQEIFTWLTANEFLAKSAEIDLKHWNPNPSPQEPIEKFKSGVKTSASSVMDWSRNLKWIGILGLVGVGLYLTWPLINRARKRIK